MSFPWGLLFVHIGVGLLFKSAVEKWTDEIVYESPVVGGQSLAPASKQDGAESEESDSEDEEDGSVDSEDELEAA